MAIYLMSMRDEAGGDDSGTIEADTLVQARARARAATQTWCFGGDWGDEGARVECWYELVDEAGETVAVDRVVVDIEPDHDALIHAAGGSTTCPHDWTSVGEGGCESNPGSWSHGGTGTSFAAHCRRCGLHRLERRTGSQYDPGEHDTVEYQQPKHWCSECESSDCACDPSDTPDDDGDQL